MIPYWKVIEEVAHRYGKLEDVFDEAHEKLELVRSGKIPFIDLETNEDRVQKRLARESRKPLRVALERIMNVANFQDKFVLDQLSSLAASVCRILKRGTPIGTGFLIGPGIIMTNNHVIQNAADADDMMAEFNYELTPDLVPRPTSMFRLDASKFFLSSSVEENVDVPHSGLDFTIIALENKGTKGEDVFDFIPVQLDGNKGKIIKGESCVIIQHPSGLVKKVVLKDTAFFSETGTRIVYESDTLPGSSGSMVVSLGTCEVVALHHSSIPRTDEQNRPLTKSGTLASEFTPEDEIAWVGNEGIKISCIVQAITEATLPEEMDAIRERILSRTAEVKRELASAPIVAVDELKSTVTRTKPVQDETSTQENSDVTSVNPGTRTVIQYFEIILTDDEILRDAWDEQASFLLPGLLSREPVISDGTLMLVERMEYIAVKSDADPWTLAQQIENLPHVDVCTPDLETLTDVGVSAGTRVGHRNVESAIYNDGTIDTDETTFRTTWGTSKWYKEAELLSSQYPNYHRNWNWLAVNCPPDPMRNADVWSGVQNNLSKIRLVQLDTGHTQHSKTYSGYDLENDFDFIDNDVDARDPTEDLGSRILLKFPSHGTRTASIAVGNRMDHDPMGVDGNAGLLTFNGSNPVRLIPYRIAKSVILIGRGKHMVNAASYGIQNGADVMFMCMGSYPRPMFEIIAREAYSRGVIWVCAAGNQVELVVAPAMYPGTIAVAAINPAGTPWAGSSNGEAVDIAAPGEGVYVPFVDQEGREIMLYGDGTSYATPHVASAAVLWKSKYYDQLKKYPQPWMVVEAFRMCLRETAYTPEGWLTNRYGAGILDIEKLLATEPPPPHTLKNVYENVPEVDKKDLGIREAGHYIWNVLRRKVTGGPLESLGATTTLSPRGRAAFQAYALTRRTSELESDNEINAVDSAKLLRKFFNQ
jgi:endonuclease G, mitochondrial